MIDDFFRYNLVSLNSEDGHKDPSHAPSCQKAPPYNPNSPVDPPLGCCSEPQQDGPRAGAWFADDGCEASLGNAPGNGMPPSTHSISPFAPNISIVWYVQSPGVSFHTNIVNKYWIKRLKMANQVVLHNGEQVAHELCRGGGASAARAQHGATGPPSSPCLIWQWNCSTCSCCARTFTAPTTATGQSRTCPPSSSPHLPSLCAFVSLLVARCTLL